LSTQAARISLKPRGRRSGRTASAAFSGDAVRIPLLLWVIHWLLVQIPATLAYHFGTSLADQGTYIFRGREIEGTASWAYGTVNVNGVSQPAPWNPGELSGLAHWLVEPMRLWDGSWYRLVAIFGYDPSKSANAAFFPLYPKLMEWISDLTGMSVETAGYLISNVAFLGALLVLYRLITFDFDPVIAKRTLWIVILFPTSFFFSAVYTESLFLLLAATTLYAARRSDWLLAGIVGLFAALTRSAGVMLLAPMAVIFLQQYGWNPRRWFPNAIPAALPALGPVIFGWILTRSGMKFDDWIHQQWQWNRFSANPIETFDCTLNGCTAQIRSWGSSYEGYVWPIDWGWIGDILSNPTWSHFTSPAWRDRAARGDVLEFVVTIAAFALVLIGIRKLPFYYTAYTVPALLVPLFSPSSVHPLMSMPRFVLPLFPLFVMLALLIRDRRLGVVLGVLSTIGLVLLTMQFASWYWVS